MNRETQKYLREIQRLKEYLKEERYLNTCLRKQYNALKEGKQLQVLPNYKETVVSKLRRIIETMYGVDISEKTRKIDVVMARHLFHYYLCINTSYSLKKIGTLLDLVLDHSTIINSRNTVEDLLGYDKSIQKDLEYINIKMNNQVINEDEIVINPS